MPLPRPRRPGSGRSPDGGLRPQVRRALEDAARSVLLDEDAWRRQALKPDEAHAVLDRMVDAIAGDQSAYGTGRDTCGSVATLGLRLSELLRRELLNGPHGLSDGDQLDLMRRIERCRARMESSSEQELVYLLTGANALELVVEFAHDLRSPLTSIMFLAETLRKGQSGEINDVQRDQLGIMYSAALGMVGVANDLMDLATSEVDTAWGGSTEEPFSLQEMVESVRGMVAPMAEQKRLRIGYYTPTNDVRVGHAVLLNRVLLNLLTNAIKFTDEGRVEIVIQEKPGDRVLFSVQDPGRGIGPEDLESLYTLFSRSESRTGYHFSGTGLGLAMCQRMIEKMGGELQVESTRGEGTRFYFELELPRG